MKRLVTLERGASGRTSLLFSKKLIQIFKYLMNGSNNKTKVEYLIK